MAIKVVSLTNASNPSGKLVNSTGSKLLIDRFLYQRLGSREQNKTILEDYVAGTLPNEFVQFLLDMETKQNDVSIRAIDEYLGALGITEEWQYSKDLRSVPMWTNEFSQSLIRQLVDTVDVLVDEYGNNIVQMREV